MSLAQSEQAKYTKVWQIAAYRHFSPGEQMLPLFRQIVRRRGTLIDIGCGTGRASAKLADAGFEVTCADFVPASRDREARALPFVKLNIFGRRWPDAEWDYGYCCDVMEHMPPEKVDAALTNIMTHCRRAFFSICFTADHFGQHVGETLHLTVQPFTWWRDKLAEHGEVTDARDLIGMGTFLVKRRAH